jgi:hypothetical protein
MYRVEWNAETGEFEFRCYFNNKNDVTVLYSSPSLEEVLKNALVTVDGNILRAELVLDF